MSYILDALRKSEQQRQRGKIPNLGGGGEPPPSRRKGGLLWFFILLLVLNAGLLTWWLLRTPTESSQPSSQVVELPQPAASPKVAPQATSQSEPEPSRTAALKTGESTATVPAYTIESPQVSSAKTSEDTTVMLVGGQEVRLTMSGSDSGESVPDQLETDVAVPESGKVSEPLSEPASELVLEMPEGFPGETHVQDEGLARYRLQEVPDEYTVPQLELTLHFYTDNVSSRMVRLNGRLLHEGDRVEEGWRLLEISAEGIVLTGPDFELFLDRP